VRGAYRVEVLEARDRPVRAVVRGERRDRRAVDRPRLRQRRRRLRRIIRNVRRFIRTLSRIYPYPKNNYPYPYLRLRRRRRGRSFAAPLVGLPVLYPLPTVRTPNRSTDTLTRIVRARVRNTRTLVRIARAPSHPVPSAPGIRMIRTLLGPISRTLILRFSVPLYFPNTRKYLHDPSQLRLDLVGAEDRAVVVVQRERVDPPTVVHLFIHPSRGYSEYSQGYSEYSQGTAQTCRSARGGAPVYVYIHLGGVL
jgi:hypothetical protein